MKTVRFVAFGCAVLAPGIALAQTADDDDVRAAIAADAAAKDLFQAGDFAAAAAEFRRSYELDPLPATLKSEAVSWFKASRCDGVETVFDQHEAELATLPTEEQKDLFVIRTDCAYERAAAHLERDEFDAAEEAIAAAEASDHARRRRTELAAMRAQIDTRRDRKAADAARAEKEVEAARLEALERENDAARAHETEVATVKATENEPRVHWPTVAGWSLIGTGAVFLGYQTAINTLVQPPRWREHEALRAELSQCGAEECVATRARADVLFRRLDRWASREEAFWILGGAFVAGGVVTLLLAPKDGVEVGLGPGDVGIRVTIRR